MGTVLRRLPPRRRRAGLGLLAPCHVSPSPSHLRRGCRLRSSAGRGRRGGEASVSPPVSGGGGTGDARWNLRRLSPVASLDAEERVQVDAFLQEVAVADVDMPCKKTMEIHPENAFTNDKDLAFKKLLKDVMGWKRQDRLRSIVSNNSYRKEKLVEFFSTHDTSENILNWLGSSERQGTLSEVLAGITSTMYAVTSMAYCKICCVDESYVCFARDDKDKWLISDFQTVEAEDTWEHLLERFKDVMGWKRQGRLNSIVSNNSYRKEKLLSTYDTTEHNERSLRHPLPTRSFC